MGLPAWGVMEERRGGHSPPPDYLMQNKQLREGKSPAKHTAGEVCSSSSGNARETLRQHGGVTAMRMRLWSRLGMGNGAVAWAAAELAPLEGCKTADRKTASNPSPSYSLASKPLQRQSRHACKGLYWHIAVVVHKVCPICVWRAARLPHLVQRVHLEEGTAASHRFCFYGRHHAPTNMLPPSLQWLPLSVQTPSHCCTDSHAKS